MYTGIDSVWSNSCDLAPDYFIVLREDGEVKLETPLWVEVGSTKLNAGGTAKKTSAEDFHNAMSWQKNNESAPHIYLPTT